MQINYNNVIITHMVYCSYQSCPLSRNIPDSHWSFLIDYSCNFFDAVILLWHVMLSWPCWWSLTRDFSLASIVMTYSSISRAANQNTFDTKKALLIFWSFLYFTFEPLKANLNTLHCSILLDDHQNLKSENKTSSFADCIVFNNNGYH